MRRLDRRGNADDAPRIDAMISEELPEVITQIVVSPNTQCLQMRCSLGTGWRLFGLPSERPDRLGADGTTPATALVRWRREISRRYQPRPFVSAFVANLRR